MNDGVDLDQDGSSGEEPSHVPGLDNLLQYLNEARGFDFHSYKRSGLERRLLKRLTNIGLTTFDEYVDYLEVHSDELNRLFDSVLINVTSFFRDPGAWEFLQQEVVPRILAAKQGSSPIRVWSAGCATGQEAYSAAMVLAQALGPEAFGRRVKIYATDLDDDALTTARQATYTAKELASVPPDLVSTYFERVGGKHVFKKECRRCVIFGRHNLLHDAPISRIDLLLCRNTLMYFNADAQSRILSSIHFALAESGVLFLGKAEMLLTHSALFAPLDVKRRLFTKNTRSYPRGRIATLEGSSARAPSAPRAVDDDTCLREAAFEHAPIAQLGMTGAGILTMINAQARKLLDLEERDVGRSIYETLLSRKLPGLAALIDRAVFERRPTQVSASELLNGEGTSFLDISAVPLVDDQSGVSSVQLSFLDVTALRRLQHELQQATQSLEAAHEELQATSEELETTNEELQSTVEELETANEELQSTNEELETTNQELQSTNEELQGMNDTLRARTGDLGRVNVYFESILISLKSAVIVLDLELHVRVWGKRAAELWGLRSDEVIGKHFFGLDIGLPVERLRNAIRACLSGAQEYQELTIAANNRRGKPINCLIKVSRLDQDIEAEGIILLMEEEQRDVS
jgi:two-component system CheB/CheR fusion protein